jgi:hypothetical protein
MSILNRKKIEDLISKNIFYGQMYAEGHLIAEEFNNGGSVSERVLSIIDVLYQMEQKAEKSYFDTNEFSFEIAIEKEPLASEIVFYISGILAHISREKGKGWRVFVRKSIGQLIPDIVITEKEASPTEKGFEKGVVAVIELRSKETIHPLMTGEDPNYFQKYIDTLGVSLNDIFIITPTLSVEYQDRIKSVAEQQEILSQSTGLPKENWVVLSENRSISNEEPQMFLTTDFDDFLKRLLER